MRIRRWQDVCLVLSLGWIVAAPVATHRARLADLEDFERTAVYLCMHAADGLPLAPRPTITRCTRKFVEQNPLRRQFYADIWAHDAVVAVAALPVIWLLGFLMAGWFRSASAAFARHED